MTPDIINVAQQEAQTASEGYLQRVLVAFDQFVNVVFKGRPDETISARAYRAALEGKVWGTVLNWCLNVIQYDHGAMAAAGDLERSLAIAATEEKTLVA
jgi:hypothetical protein